MGCLICEKKISKELVKENTKLLHFFMAFFGIKNACAIDAWKKIEEFI